MQNALMERARETRMEFEGKHFCVKNCSLSPKPFQVAIWNMFNIPDYIPH